MKKQKIPITGMVMQDKNIVEMVYVPEEDKTKLLVSNGEEVSVHEQYEANDKLFVPYSESNSLIKNNIVLLPSGASDYESVESLLEEVKNFIHKYVDLAPIFEKLSAHYVLLSWVYDGFNQIPYLRKLGDFGTGKTRFLTTIGSICYKPIFASGSSSISAIFRILDEFKGTLILDEADFKFSDEKADITKILNSGFMKGYPILRCAFNKNKEFDPVGYQVYGCKVIASRKHFHDQALESRFITEKTSFRKLRDDIPNELPNTFEQEALNLRNKLLQYRFDMLTLILEYRVDWKIKGIEPRVNQIFSPLMQLADDDFKKQLKSLAIECSKQIQKDRSATIEYHVLLALKSLLCNSNKVCIKDIADTVFIQYADYYDRKITPRWTGHVVSKSLNIKTYKSSGKFHISPNQEDYLNTLYVRYGLD
ncbi:MAG: hypothetical protein ACRBEE_12385 [Arenicella sp.]